MTILRKIAFECDGCGDEEDTGLTDFESAYEHIKEQGWITRKIGDEWRHYCSRECYNDNRY